MQCSGQSHLNVNAIKWKQEKTLAATTTAKESRYRNRLCRRSLSVMSDCSSLTEILQTCADIIGDDVGTHACNPVDRQQKKR